MRFCRPLPAIVALLVLGAACQSGPGAGVRILLPEQLALSGVPLQRLRAELTLAGVLPTTALEIDTAAGVATGTFVVPGDDVAGVVATIEYFSGATTRSPEVLIARATGLMDINSGNENTLVLNDLVASGEPVFDLNRNGLSNLEDLQQGFDPAPGENPVDISPRNISFESGVEVGGFTRSFFVLENRSARPVHVDMNVLLAPGVSLVPLARLYDNAGGSATTTQSIDLDSEAEEFFAVTFAPANPLFVAGGISVRVTEPSGVEHGTLIRVLGNPQGAFTQPPADYAAPDPPTGPVAGIDPSVIEVMPANVLFSGAFRVVTLSETDAGTTSLDLSEGGIDVDGVTTDVDFAYLIAVPPRFRFSMVVDGLSGDADLYLIELDATYQPVGGRLSCDPGGQCSRHLGNSVESVAFDATDRTSVAFLLVGFDRVLGPNAAANAVPITGTVQTGLFSVPEFLRPCAGCPPRIESSQPCPAAYDPTIVCGDLAGGDTVRLRGHNFRSGAVVTIGGTEGVCTDVQTTGDIDEITCLSPPALVDPTVEPNVTVVVRNPDGQAATLAEGFTYLPPPPDLQAVLPNRGPTTGGMTAVLLGDNFFTRESTLPTVKFAGLLAQVSALEADRLTVVTPACGACSTGVAVAVEVENPDGQLEVLAAAFTYVMPLGPPPAITAITPAMGSSEGGTAVVLTGSGFSTAGGGARVVFGGAAATIQTATASQLDVFTPPGAPGAVEVEVLNPDGQTARTAFTYVAQAPFITSVTPPNGPRSGGQPVTITGGRFAAGAVVRFGGSAATQVIVSAGDTIQCLTPPGLMAGPVAVLVQNLNGTSVSRPMGYTYDPVPPPDVTGVTPNSGPVAGGSIVFVSGTGFQNGAVVRFGGVDATQTLFNNGLLLTVTTPAGSVGTVNVAVENPDGQIDQLMGGFSYQAPTAPAPLISSVSPNVGPPAVSTPVTITGANFVSGLQVFFGSIAAQAVDDAGVPTQVVATAPPGTPNTNVTLRVQNPDGQIALGSYSYASGGGFVTAVFPREGPADMPTSVVITGAGFVSDVGVVVHDRMGWGRSASQVTVLSNTVLTATLPPYSGGGSGDVAVDVIVESASAGEIGRLDLEFDYLGAGGSVGMMPSTVPVTPFVMPPCLNVGTASFDSCYGGDWLDFVQRADVMGSCTGSESGGPWGCIHSGEYVAIELPAGVSSCANVTVDEVLGAFQWACDDRSTPLVLVSNGLRADKGLTDLIDFSVPAFLKNGVTVYDDDMEVLSTAGETWWSNSFTADPPAGDLGALGEIFVVRSNFVGSYNFDSPRQALVIQPGFTMSPGSTDQMIIEDSSESFYWVEGAFDGAAGGGDPNRGIYVFGSNVILRNVSVTKVGSGECILLAGQNALLHNVKASSCGVGIRVSTAGGIHGRHIRTGGNQFGIDLQGGADMVWDDVSVMGEQNGLNLDGTQTSHFANFTVVGSPSAGAGVAILSGDYNTFVNFTVANIDGAGIAVSDSQRNYFSNILVVNTVGGFDVDGLANDNNVFDLATAHNSTDLTDLGDRNAYLGELFVSSGVCASSLMVSQQPLTDVTCTDTGTSGSQDYPPGSNSGAIFTEVFSLGSTFVGELSTDDAQNPDDTNGAGTQLSVTDWVNFDNPYRGWGVDGGNFPTGGRGYCGGMTSNCRIWDWSLLSGGGVIHNNNTFPPTGNDVLFHTYPTFATGQATCDSVHPGSVFDGMNACEALFLAFAVEIPHDGAGNDNGLCEGGERCVYSPNIASYQGHGPLLALEPFSDGLVSGVTLLAYRDNGY